jgi:hypothetical protein
MVSYNERIPAVPSAEVDNQPLRFSFKYLDFSNEKFSPSNCSTVYLNKLFAVLQRFSTWRVSDFVDQYNHQRRHIINFEQTTEKDGFQHIPEIDRDQFGSSDGWQFGVFFEGEWHPQWRAHGILVDDTFYLVWLDERHLLYP